MSESRRAFRPDVLWGAVAVIPMALKAMGITNCTKGQCEEDLDLCAVAE